MKHALAIWCESQLYIQSHRMMRTSEDPWIEDLGLLDAQQTLRVICIFM